MNVFELYAKLKLDDSEYESAMKGALGTASKAANKIDKGLNKVLKVGAAAAGAATAGFVAFTKSAVTAGAEFDTAMSQVAATMGTTVDEIQDLRVFAQEMGAKTAFSATQAAQALNYMALAGYDAETSMKMLPNVLNLAAAGGIDLARASDMITDAQSALGLTLPQTNEMVDQMAATASKSNTSVAQLGDAFLTIGATARSVKGGTEELATILGVLADNGIKGAEGGTHLRNMILSLQSPTSDAQKILDQFSISLYDSDGNMRSLVDVVGDLQKATEGMDQASRDAVLGGIFNKTDLAAVNALVGTSRERFDELTSAIHNSTGAAEAMANTQLDNLNGDITLMKSALEGVKIQFSDGITPAIRNVVQLITKSLAKKSTQKYLNELGTKLGELTEILTGKVMNAIPRLLSLFDDGGVKIKAFAGGFAALTLAVKAIVNPFGAAATALAAFTGYLALSELTADDARKKYGGLTSAQRDVIDAALDQAAAYREEKEERDSRISAISDEAEKMRGLWAELNTLTDSEGKVKEENRERAQTILNELNDALGTELELDGDIITQNGEVVKSIDAIIEKKKALAMLDVAEQNYNDAKSGLETTQSAIYQSEKEVGNLNERLGELQAQYDNWNSAISDPANQYSYTYMSQQMGNTADEIRKVQTELAGATSRLEEAKTAESTALQDMALYTNAYKLALEGNYAAVATLLENDSLNRLNHKIETGKITDEELAQLEEDMNTAQATLERYLAKQKEGTGEVTDEQISEMQAHVDELIALWQKAQEDGSKESSEAGETSAEEYATGIESKSGDAESAANSVSGSALAELASRHDEFYAEGAAAGAAWSSGFADNQHSGGTHSSGKFAIGLDYVPANNYPAVLHRGEAVLNAREADVWRRGGSGQTSSQPIQVNVTAPVVIDGATLARQQYNFLIDLNDAHGPQLIRG